MLAKLVEGVIDPSCSGALAGAIEGEFAPRLLEHDGASFGWWMLDASNGRVLAITLWDDPDSMRVAAASDGAERSATADRIALRVLSVQAVPVLAARSLTSSTGAGAPCRSARVTWVEGAPASARQQLPELYEEIAADQVGSSGFCGSFWLGEHLSGEGCAVSMWEQPTDLSGGTSASRRRRRRVARTLGCRISRVHEYRILGTAARTDGSDPRAHAKGRPLSA